MHKGKRAGAVQAGISGKKNRSAQCAPMRLRSAIYAYALRMWLASLRVYIYMIVRRSAEIFPKKVAYNPKIAYISAEVQQITLTSV